MQRVGLHLIGGATCALIVLAGVSHTRIASAQAPTAAASPFCTLSPDAANPWLPNTPLPAETTIPTPHAGPGDPSDCQFYRPAWQRFLVATQTGPGGRPAFLDYPSFDSLFTNSPAPMLGGRTALILTPRIAQRPNQANAAVENLLDTSQAGIGGTVGGALIDRNGHTIFYAINVNPDFARFTKANHLDTVSGILAADQNLSFLGPPPDSAKPQATNIVEYKSAWMIVDKNAPPSNYIVVDALIPHMVLDKQALVQETGPDGKPRFDKAKVALIALHVAFTLPGHPELVWSTFEHVHLDGDGTPVRDNAPAAAKNPADTSSTAPINSQDYPLYAKGTLPNVANKALAPTLMATSWNVGQQAFLKPDGTPLSTPVYRPYPASKPNTADEDGEVVIINNNATALFAAAANKAPAGSAPDRRQFYRLVGATWLDQPLAGNPPFFRPQQSFEVGENQSADDPGQQVVGETRLGSTAMESFTEFGQGAPNCFSCHDTNRVSDHGQRVPAKLLNVSHVFSRWVGRNTASTQ